MSQPVALPVDEWLESTSFRNLCLFYRDELTEIHKSGRPPVRDPHFTKRRSGILQERGVILKIKQAAYTSPAYRYYLTPNTIEVLGLKPRKEAPP